MGETRSGWYSSGMVSSGVISSGVVLSGVVFGVGCYSREVILSGGGFEWGGFDKLVLVARWLRVGSFEWGGCVLVARGFRVG